MKAVLSKVSVLHPGGIVALRSMDLCVPEGAISILIGPSGAGKSTVLRCLNGALKPSSGNVLIDDIDLATVNGTELRNIRRRIALIPQQFGLIKRESVLTNVLTGCLGSVSLIPGLLGLFSQDDQDIAMRNIVRMGLEDKIHRRVDTLSGGEQQRVAVARALTQQPRLILADEPVSNLDQSMAVDTMELFRRINEEDGITVLIALHDLRLVERFGNQIIALDKGSLVHVGRFAEVEGKLRLGSREPAPV